MQSPGDFISVGIALFGRYYINKQTRRIAANLAIYAAFLVVKITEDGSTDVVPQILYGQYLILGVFGSCMF